MTITIDLSGKKALVTGASRGLGRAMAEALLEAGAQTAIMGSGDTVFDVARDYAGKGYDCHGVRADFLDPAATEAGFREALHKLDGTPDILITAAGIQRRSPAEHLSPADWAAITHVNLNSVFQMCQLCGNEMLRQGRGKIINVASMLSYFGGMNASAYAASKGGVAQLTKALSNEWAGRGICVNAVAPGYMETDLNTDLLADTGRNAEITARIPAGRWGRPGDMKGVTLFLASDWSDYVTGAVVPVDGGYLSK